MNLKIGPFFLGIKGWWLTENLSPSRGQLLGGIFVLRKSCQVPRFEKGAELLAQVSEKNTCGVCSCVFCSCFFSRFRPEVD